ncbi:type II toxin-antitoxin system RelE family toxin [Phormidesmis sp. 146-12]
MDVAFRKSFEKDLGKLRDQALLEGIRAEIEAVENAETLQDVNNLKKIKGEDNYYRIRVRDYRIGLTVDGNIVTFVRVLHRKEVYRYFP